MDGRWYGLPDRRATKPSPDDDESEWEVTSTVYDLEPRRTPRAAAAETTENNKPSKEWSKYFRGRLRSTSTNTRATSSDRVNTKGPLGLHLLHPSPQPLIDLIFVHGLGGDSIKTWRKGNDPWLFWPQRWLPMEAEFHHASIHSFGYASDWKDSKPSILSVHDFGQALYEEIKAAPHLRQNPESPIILIGHSMGGLVIKKAFILAHQDSTATQIADRLRCIFFLATPHRGSDYASILNKVLKYGGIVGMSSSRDYINDLKKGSGSAQIINDDFARYANNLPIHSFFESLETNIGPYSSLLVDKESAVLGAGFTMETSRYMNANHREMCKFDSPDDSNYQALRNSLGSMVQVLLKDVFSKNDAESKSQLRTVQTSLGIALLQDEHHEKIAGSCEWIDERADFRDWRDTPADLQMTEATNSRPSIYWVTASPGSGKTILANYVASQLAEFNLQSATYYFHVGKKSSQSLAGCLRSIAFQMAANNAMVRDVLAKIFNDGFTYDQDDARAIWRKVFSAGIFQMPILAPQYWVIDAVDECIKYPELFTLLRGVQCRFPLRIFLTSRKLRDMQKLTCQLEGCVTVEIPRPDTIRDIELFIRSRMEFLPIDNDSEKQELEEEILHRSDGSFLWVRLVMDELEIVYGYESIMAVLRGIPEGMISYYQRTVKEMAENTREKHITKAILTWVVSASRPLTVSELSEALKLDIKVHLPSAKTAIEGLCGQLVCIHKHTEVVHLVHTTAREFLISEEAGEFRIRSSESHERIALTCLQLLIGPSMQRPRHRTLVNQKRPEQNPSVLLDYAISEFSEHLFGASAQSDKLLVALDRFLTLTVLTWIDRVASKGVLHRLIRVARNLRSYLDRRAKYSSPLNKHVKTVDGWATDLTRLATKFGGALTSQHHSIYFLIPPLCPTESAIYRQFGKSPDGLTCSGFDNSNWDDCAATVHLGHGNTSTVTCNNGLIAVGFESGDIHLYNNGSCQKDQEISHSSPIDLLLLDPLGSFVAAASIKHLTVSDLNGKLLWKKRLRSRCILLTCTSTYIVAVTMAAQAYYWDIATGEQVEEHRYLYQPFDSTNSLSLGGVKAPFTASISPGMELLALGYKSGPVSIYELQSDTWISWAIDENSRNAAQVVFNPNPEISLLLVAYDEGHLALYDAWSGVLIQSQPSETHAVYLSLSCSADGRTFGTVDVMGNLQIWDFESLSLLYHVLTPSHSFRMLEFSSDGFNLVDTTEHEMKIWSPSILIRKTIEEEASISDQAAVITVTEGQYDSFQSAKIRSMIAHETLSAVFSGNHNGDILVHQPSNGYVGRVLYSHSNEVVKCLAVTRNSIIASGDVAGLVQVQQLNKEKSSTVVVGHLLFQTKFSAAIRQLVFDASGRYLLVSTQDSDHVYETSSGKLVGSIPAASERRIWRWLVLQNKEGSSSFALVCNHSIISYPVEVFSEASGNRIVELEYDVVDGFTEIGIDFANADKHTGSLIFEVRQQNKYLVNSCTFIFKLEEACDEKTTMTLRPVRILKGSFCSHVLGVNTSDHKLLFLHRNSWVCSLDLQAMGNFEYIQHFFVPNEFVSKSIDVLPTRAINDDVVFCIYDQVAVVKNGLKFQEIKTLE